MPISLFVNLATLLLTFSLCQPCYNFAYISLHRFQVHILLTRHLPRGQYISCPTHNSEQSINKPFTELIGLRHVTTSQEVTHQSCVEICFPRIPVFKNNIYSDSFLLPFDVLWKVKGQIYGIGTEK